MARDYSWSRNSIPPRLNTIGELAGLLGLGRHQTRRRLIASGLPYRVYTRRWQDPSGRWFSRRAIGIPQKTAAEPLKLDMINSVGAGWKGFCRSSHVTMRNPLTRPPSRQATHSSRCFAVCGVHAKTCASLWSYF